MSFSDLEFGIFVGYASDAKADAESIVAIQQALQDSYEARLRKDDRCRTVKVWIWNQSASAEQGGQEAVVNPFIDSAKLAIFVFRKRLGATSRKEFERCRNNGTPILAFFAEASYAELNYRDLSELDAWKDLIAFERTLDDGWNDKKSKALTPQARHRSLQELLDNVQEKVIIQFKHFLDIEPSPKTEAVEPIDVARQIDLQLLKAYRARLRPGSRDQLNKLTDAQLLRRQRFIVEERMTLCGSLFFLPRPAQEIPSALVSCSRYKGRNKESVVESIRFEGDLISQLEGAFEFIKDRAEQIEVVSGRQLARESVSEYPMRCVREVLANALCHRDYADVQRIVYVRMFSDRLEISSPGKPLGIDVTAEAIPLSRFKSESNHRNIDVSNALASMNIVEMDGQGIPRAIEDCQVARIAEPIVWYSQGFLTVRIQPSVPKTNSDPDSRETFFISRAGADSEFAVWLAGELRAEGHNPIVQDDEFGHSNFLSEMNQALDGSSKVIALYSKEYFASQYCLAEAKSSIATDPNNTNQRLIPLRISPCVPTGILQSIAFTDLVEARNQGAMALREAIWIALGLTDRPDQTGPREVTRPGWVHGDVYRDPRFLGREDLLARINGELKSGDTIALKALKGAGGVGKSALAREYAARHQGDYAGVWWIRAESPETLASDLIELGAKFIPGLAEAQDRDAATRAALEAIEHQGGTQDWLLVYDNVPNPSVLAGKTPRKGAKILITSRHARWQGTAREVDVDVFAPDVAVAFLLERTGRSDEAGAAEVADRLGYLPLALEQAAGYLTTSTLAFTGENSYLTHLDEMIQRAPDGMQAERSVFGAVSLSLETANGLHPKAGFLFGLMAWMDAERIPMSLFEDTPAFQGLELDEAIRALVGTSLAKPTPLDDGAPALTVHRLSQDVMRSRLKAAGEDEAALGAALVLLASAMAALQPQDVRNWPALDVLDPHGQATLAHADRTGHESIELAEILNVMGLLRKTRAQFANAEPLVRRALAIHVSTRGKSDPTVAVSLNNLATLMQDTNRFSEAELLIRKALEIDEAVYGPEHPEVAVDLNNLAAMLQATNRLSEAEPLLVRTVEIVEGSLGPEHPNVATALNNLAQLLWATNRAGESEPLMRRTLEIYEAAYGDDHPNVARGLNNLAQLLKATNRMNEAEPLVRRALAIDEAAFGPDHPNVATGLNNLAQLLQATNRLNEGEPLMRRALAIDEAAFGPDHPNVAIRLKNLALLLHATNRSEEAEQLLRRALNITTAAFGEDHPSVAVDLNSLAQLFHATGRKKDAEELVGGRKITPDYRP